MNRKLAALGVMEAALDFLIGEKATSASLYASLRRELRAQVRGALTGQFGQSAFEDGFYFALQNAFPEAYRLGLATCGVEEPPEAEEQREIDAAIIESVDALYAFSTDLFTGRYAENITPSGQQAGAFARVDVYANQVNKLYALGQAAGCANQMMVWRLGSTREHCKDCLRLNGQKHRMKDWERKGWLPQSFNLTCQGWRCLCRLEPTRGKAQGRF